MSNKTVLSSYFIKGKKINAPLEWQNSEVYATFDNDSIQANITTTEITFALEAATKLMSIIEEGKRGGVGVFEGVDFKMNLFNESNKLTAFDGCIDLSDNLEINEAENKVKAKIRLKSQLFTLEERLQALSYQFLKEKGVITDSDFATIDYVVNKKTNSVEVIMLSFVIYLMIKELADGVARLIAAIVDATALLVILPLGPAGAILLGIGRALVTGLYVTLMVLAVKDLATSLLDELIPVTRKAKCFKLKNALEKVCQYLGYGFKTNITELSEMYYLPSNNEVDEVDNKGFTRLWRGCKRGIPQPEDYGYKCDDMFDLAKKRFNAKFAIVGNDVWFYNERDDVWAKQSTLRIADTLQAKSKKKFNTNEIIANRLFSFSVDYADGKTIENFRGTNYEVITSPKVIENKKEVYLKGLEEIRFGCALGNRKDKLTGFENFIVVCAGFVDSITKFFKKPTTFKKKMKSKVGMLVIGTNNWTTPKLLRLNSSLRMYDRDFQSAKYVAETYYKSPRQKEIYEDIKIPFSLEKFVQVANNSYFFTSNGKVAKITKLNYKFSENTATVSYWIENEYTNNLIETKIEPNDE